MKKGMIAAMLGICVCLAGATAYITVTTDKDKPQILFGQEELVCQPDAGEDVLLADVTATDKKDGDVTASLLIEGIYPDEGGQTATVIYVAKDEANNITKAKRTIRYGEPGSTESQPPVPAEEPAPQPEVKEEQPGQTETAETKEKTETAEQTEKEEQLPPENPKITLTESTVVIKAGEGLDRLSYVDEIVDDKDERSSLFQNIQIKSKDLDVNKAGTYEVV